MAHESGEFSVVMGIQVRMNRTVEKLETARLNKSFQNNGVMRWGKGMDRKEEAFEERPCDL